MAGHQSIRPHPQRPHRRRDIGSKFTIHSILRELASQGMGVIIISDDIAEVLTNCSTIAIMRAGHLSDPISPDTLTEAELTRLLSEDRAPASSIEGGEN